MILGELYKFCCEYYKEHNILDVSEIKIILKYTLDINTNDLILDKNKIINQDKVNEILEILKLRINNIPLQYILKSWEFMGLNFCVGPGVLIPREDTSVLVNFVINILKKRVKPENTVNIIDLCSGTGCVAIVLESVLKNYIKNINIYALEKSSKAIEYLTKNKQINNSNIKITSGDVFIDHNEFPDNFFDCIVSNPPYIKTNDIQNLQKEVQQEPFMALDGGPDGLDFYRNITKFWSKKLKNHSTNDKNNGVLAFEVGYDQAECVEEILLNFDFKKIYTERDINNIVRVVAGET